MGYKEKVEQIAGKLSCGIFWDYNIDERILILQFMEYRDSLLGEAKQLLANYKTDAYLAGGSLFIEIYNI